MVAFEKHVDKSAIVVKHGCKRNRRRGKKWQRSRNYDWLGKYSWEDVGLLMRKFEKCLKLTRLQSVRCQEILDVAPHCNAVEKKSVGFALAYRRIQKKFWLEQVLA